MEERIIDDVMGRGIRLKKTKDGYVDVTDELAPEEEDVEETGEEIAVVLPEVEGVDEEDSIPLPMQVIEVDDEDLVDLSPEEAERIRKQKEEALARRKKIYENTCKEGAKLLAEGSFKAAELVYEKALEYDEVATEASAGYWRAKTANFTDPDVLVEEYLEGGMEEMEYDLGFSAVDIIKQEFHEAFQKRYDELCEQEAPYVKKVLEKQKERRAVLSKRRLKTGLLFVGLTLPFLAVLVATAWMLAQNFSTPDDTYLVPTIVMGCVSIVLFIASLVGVNQFFNACRMYNMNEKLSSTDDGKAILEIRQYKKIYEGLLVLPLSVITDVEEEKDEK